MTNIRVVYPRYSVRGLRGTELPVGVRMALGIGAFVGLFAFAYAIAGWKGSNR